MPIVGDVKRVLAKLNKLIAESPADPPVAEARCEWWRQVRGWKEEHPLVAQVSDSEIKPQHVMREDRPHLRR